MSVREMFVPHKTPTTIFVRLSHKTAKTNQTPVQSVFQCIYNVVLSRIREILHVRRRYMCNVTKTKPQQNRLQRRTCNLRVELKHACNKKRAGLAAPGWQRRPTCLPSHVRRHQWRLTGVRLWTAITLQTLWGEMGELLRGSEPNCQFVRFVQSVQRNWNKLQMNWIHILPFSSVQFSSVQALTMAKFQQIAQPQVGDPKL